MEVEEDFLASFKYEDKKDPKDITKLTKKSVPKRQPIK